MGPPEQQEKVRSRRTSRLDGPRSALWIAFEFLQASLDKRGAQSVPSFREEEKSGGMVPLHVATAGSEYRRKSAKGRHLLQASQWRGKGRTPTVRTVGPPTSRPHTHEGNQKTGQEETKPMSVQGEFEAAITTAQRALEEFNKEPIVDSKRGGPRLSPWFRVWRDASEIAQRWHRQLPEERPPSLDETIDRLLGAEGGS